MAKWRYCGKWPVTKDPSKKHNLRTSLSFSARATGTSGDGYWTLDDVNVYNEDNPMHYVYSFDGVTISETRAVSGRPSKEYQVDVYSESEVTISNVSLTHTYGAVAVPRPACSQNGGYMRPDVENTFTVSAMTYNYIDEAFTIKKAKWFYKESDDVNYSYIEKTYDATTPSGSFEVPANTLTTGKTYNQYLEVTSDDDQVVTLSMEDITTVDGTPEVVTKSPSNTVVYGETAFTWEYSNTRGTLQYAYDLEISDDNGTSWTQIFSHEVSSSTTSDVYTGILAGNYLWRVRAYNMDDVVSAWSDPAGFLCNVPPTAPEINEVVPGGRVTVRWSASGQKAYRLRIVDQNDSVIYDSGDVYSINSEAFINEYLPDGDYTAQVKIFNSYGLESAYGEFEFTQAQQIADPIVTGANAGGGLITVANANQYEVCYLKRNGELIASFTGGTYLDKFASGVTEYTVIAVDSNDQFGMKSVTVDVQQDSPMLIRKDGTAIELENRWNNRAEVSQAENTRYEAQEYLGASVPVHIFAKMRTKRITVSFADHDRIAKSLLGEVVYYADGFGNGDWVAVISSSRSDQWFGDETVLQLEMTDGDEGIQYEI